MASNFINKSDITEESVTQLPAVQVVLQFNHDPQHVLNVAKRMLKRHRLAARQSSLHLPGGDARSKTASNANPFDAVSLLREVELQYGAGTFEGFTGGERYVPNQPYIYPTDDNHSHSGTAPSHEERREMSRHSDEILDEESLQEDGGEPENAMFPAASMTEFAGSTENGSAAGSSARAICGSDRDDIQLPTIPSSVSFQTQSSAKRAYVLPIASKSSSEEETRSSSCLGKAQPDHGPKSSKTALQEKVAVLKRENARLRDRLNCRHCRQRPANLTLLPCGHFFLCAECGATFSKCPVCHKTVLADVRTFVS